MKLDAAGRPYFFITGRLKELIIRGGINYSQLMHGLKLAGVELDRKVLADLAVNQPDAFKQVSLQAKNALETKSERAAA